MLNINGRLFYDTAEYADHQCVSVRSVRNWITEGHFPAYRINGRRGVVSDVAEADAALSRLPSTVVRPGRTSQGPKARIRTLPVVVDE